MCKGCRQVGMFNLRGYLCFKYFYKMDFINYFKKFIQIGNISVIFKIMLVQNNSCFYLLNKLIYRLFSYCILFVTFILYYDILFLIDRGLQIFYMIIKYVVFFILEFCISMFFFCEYVFFYF